MDSGLGEHWVATASGFGLFVRWAVELRSERWLSWFCSFVKERAALAGGVDYG